MKRVICLIIVIILTSLVFSQPCYAVSNLSSFSNNKYNYCYTDNTGAYFFGFSNYCIRTARVMPDFVSYQYQTEGVVRTVSHNGKITYALTDEKGFDNYAVTAINTDNGVVNKYLFSKLEKIDYSSFSVCDNKVFFIKLNPKGTSGIVVYSLNGTKIMQLNPSSGVKSLFTNNSVPYAVLENGNVCRITNDGLVTVITLGSTSSIKNCGPGFICSSTGTVYSLVNGQALYNTDKSPVACDNENIFYADGNYIHSISLRESTVGDYNTLSQTKNLLHYKNSVFVIHYDYTFRLVAVSAIKSQSDYAGDSGDYSNAGDGRFLFVEQGITIARLKDKYTDITSVYDNKGNPKSSGQVGTGFKARTGHDNLTLIIPGDLTGEGNIKSNDLRAIMNHLSLKSSLKGSFLIAADYNRDGAVDTRDMLLISQAYGK